MPDDVLARLLERRPDLAVPAPRDIDALAGRASNPYSLVRAVQGLNLFETRVLETLLVLPQPTDASLDEAMSAWAPWERTLEALRRLGDLALAWQVAGPREASGAIATCPGLVQVIPRPLGLGPRAAALFGALPGRDLSVVADALRGALGETAPSAKAGRGPGRLSGRRNLAAVPRLENHGQVAELLQRAVGPVLASAPDHAVEVLRVVAAGNGVGEVADALDRVLDADSPNAVTWLMSRGMLVATDERIVEMPREVAVAVRERLVPLVTPDPPDATGPSPGPVPVDAAAAGAVSELTRHVADLLDLWTAEPPSTLKSGGIGVRELRRTARALSLSEEDVALLVTAAHAAGLVAAAMEEDAVVMLPTPRYDAWLDEPESRRWLSLAAGWLEARRWPALTSGGGPGGRAAALLSGDDVRADAPELRRHVLEALADLPPGTAPDPAGLVDALRWHRPYLGDPAPFVPAVLAEAALLGLLGRGALASPARELLAGDPEAADRTLDRLLPDPVEEVLVQADHTVIVPGPMRPDLARTFATLADRESTGAATVFRITEQSLRRALDAGLSADEVKEFLTTRSRTPVPQSLTYLVEDTARRYGRLRLGPATTYVRCDDEAHLAELLADRRLKGLRLRRVAPTVLVADLSVARALDLLRGAGFAPVAEAPDGMPLRHGAAPRRAAAPPSRGGRGAGGAAAGAVGRTGAATGVNGGSGGARATAPDVATLVARLRTADHARRSAEELARRAGSRRGGRPLPTPAEMLRQAAALRQAVWMSYIDDNGAATDRVVEPISVTGRIVDAYDHLTADRRTFLLDRVVTVATLEDTLDEAVAEITSDAGWAGPAPEGSP